MNIRRLLGLEPKSEAIDEEPTPVGADAFTDVAPFYDELMAAVPYKS